jgi:hypothetical protein
MVLTGQVLFLTTALPLAARARWSPVIAIMANSVVFSRWDLFSFGGA